MVAEQIIFGTKAAFQAAVLSYNITLLEASEIFFFLSIWLEVEVSAFEDPNGNPMPSFF